MNPDNTIVTFNGANYDLPLLWHVIKGADNAAAKKASDEIIRDRIPRWEVERRLGIRIPQELADRHIDLIEPQPNAFAGLKALNGRLHGNRLQDLPFDPDLRPTSAQMDRIAGYCRTSDLDATRNLWTALKEPLELRRALGAEYGENFMSLADAQIDEAILKKRVQQLTAAGGGGSGPGRQRNSTPTPHEWLAFQTPDLRTFWSGSARPGSRSAPQRRSARLAEDRKVTAGRTEYAMGMGAMR